MIRNILIEGIDRAGKSTLVKELKNELGWDTRFLGHRPVTPYIRYLREYAALEETIIERGHISEMIYSRLFGRENPFTPEELLVLEGLVKTTMLVVFASPRPALALERWHQRTLKQTVPLADVSRGADAFTEWFSSHRYPQLLVYRSENFEELAQTIVKIKGQLG